ncbi:MAG: ATP-grasp domain-containing protein [Planctomycetota bacterium]|nr:ATP-grasp domain-containing protein [Planctomycetota bacterium]
MSSLIREGLAMLSGLANDLALCDHEVHTLLDRQTVHATTHFRSQVHVHSLDSTTGDSRWLEQWSDLAKACDLAIVVAPELDNQLACIVEHLRSSGAKVLAPSVPFLQATSDKLTTAKLLSQSDIAHPRTQTLTEFQAMQRSKGLGGSAKGDLPLTLKRRDGAGCADMMIFADRERLERWLSIHASLYLTGEDWLVQEWLIGRPASMAIIAGQEWRIVGAVEQNMQCDTANQDGWSSVSYLGGRGPLQGITDEILEQLAGGVQQALPDEAAGWIGVDFLVPNDPTQLRDYVVVEINPRLTTSYLGYRKWYGPQLAGTLLKTPDNPAFFSAMQKPPIEFSVYEFAKNHGET